MSEEVITSNSRVPMLGSSPDPQGEALVRLTASEIDDLPFGYVALRSDGTVLRYNQYESDLARKDKRQVIGRNFFTEVAPCTQVQEFEGRFKAFVDDASGPSTASFDFVFAFRHGLQNVRIGLIKSPSKDEIIMTVNRRQVEKLSLQPGTRVDPETGEITDLAGRRAITTTDDVWRALDSVFAEVFAEVGTDASLKVGLQWGIQQAFRVDRHIQRERAKNIREIKLNEACEVLSRAMWSMGLGRFKLDPTHYSKGLLVIIHSMSPFVEFFSSRESGSCAILSGFHAGQFSYLSGRRLTGREIFCSPERGVPCRFIVGTAERIDQIMSAPADSSDAQLLAQLRPTTSQQNHLQG